MLNIAIFYDCLTYDFTFVHILIDFGVIIIVLGGYSRDGFCVTKQTGDGGGNCNNHDYTHSQILYLCLSNHIFCNLFNKSASVYR